MHPIDILNKDGNGINYETLNNLILKDYSDCALKENVWRQFVNLPLDLVRDDLWEASFKQKLSGKKDNCVYEAFMVFCSCLSKDFMLSRATKCVFRVIDVLDEIISPQFFSRVFEEHPNESMSFWMQLARLIVHVPDKIENLVHSLEASDSPWWTRDVLFPRICSGVVNSAGVLPSGVVRQIVSILVNNGAHRFLAECILERKQEGASAVYGIQQFGQRCAEKIIVEGILLLAGPRFGDLPLQQRGQLLADAITNNSEIDPKVCLWFCETVPSTCSFDLNACKVLVQSYACLKKDGNCLQRAISRILRNFNDKFLVSSSCTARLLAQVRILLPCFTLLSAQEIDSCRDLWTGLFLKSTSNFLDISLQQTRVLGLAVSEALSKLLNVSGNGSHKLDFQLDKNLPIVAEIQLLSSAEIWSSAKETSALAPPTAAPTATHAEAAKGQLVDSDDEDPEFEPFYISESDDEVPFSKRVLPPKTLAELLAYVKPLPGPSQSSGGQRKRSGLGGVSAEAKSDPHLDVTRLELAVNCGEKLVKGADSLECETHCSEIVNRFTNLTDDYDIAGFSSKVNAILTAITLRCPVAVAPALAGIFYSRNVTHMQRICMLDILVAATLSLSNMDSSSTWKVKDVESFIKPVEAALKQRGQSTIRRPVSLQQSKQKRSSTHKNVFASLAEYFFWPLLNGWYSSNFATEHIFTSPENLFLVEKLIAALGVIVHCSSLSPMISDILLEYWRFIVTFRSLVSNRDTYKPLRRALIFALSVLVAFPNWMLKEKHNVAMFYSVSSWVAEMVNSEVAVENLQTLLNATAVIEEKQKLINEAFWGREVFREIQDM